MMTPRKVCVVTGNRAEYGLLRWVIEEIKRREALRLQLVATGTHLVPAYGSTEWEILNDGFTIDRRVEIVLSSDSGVAVAKSYGLAVMGIADALDSLRPDVVLLLGDRYEIHAAAVAALHCRIPIAHIHGGEVTAGSLDDPFRHSITKMAQGHLVAHEVYGRRVIQLGEDPATVILSGGLGFESARRADLLSRLEVERQLSFTFQQHNVMLVFHPETSTEDAGLSTLTHLCEEVGRLADCGVVVSLPNADIGGASLRTCLRQFVECHPFAVGVESMGHRLFLSTMNLMTGLVGNSSSGLLEAPALGIPSLDVGSRQSGRIAAGSVVHSDGDPAEIRDALQLILSAEFHKQAQETKASLADLPTSEIICDVLESDLFSKWEPRPFLDTPPTSKQARQSG